MSRLRDINISKSNSHQGSIPVTFTRMRAVSRSILYVAAMPDQNEVGSSFTRLGQYNTDKWEFENFDFWTENLSLFKNFDVDYQVLKLMTPDGEIFDLDNLKQHDRIVSKEDYDILREKYRLGRFLYMKQIQNKVYVVGDGGQNYCKEHDGIWKILSESILDPFVSPDWANEPGKERDDWDSILSLFTENTEDAHEFRRRQALSIRNTLLWRVNGTSDNDIYLCGANAALFHWNGSAMRAIFVDTKNALTDILVESSKRVWICGRDGFLAVGNAANGFRSVPNSDGHSFSSMAMLNGRHYIASVAGPRGLFEYDGTSFRRVRSGLNPDIDDINQIEAVDGVLWAVGSKDILRFDGESWERIDHPDNPPLGKSRP